MVKRTHNCVILTEVRISWFMELKGSMVLKSSLNGDPEINAG